MRSSPHSGKERVLRSLPGDLCYPAGSRTCLTWAKGVGGLWEPGSGGGSEGLGGFQGVRGVWGLRRSGGLGSAEIVGLRSPDRGVWGRGRGLWLGEREVEGARVCSLRAHVASPPVSAMSPFFKFFDR